MALSGSFETSKAVFDGSSSYPRYMLVSWSATQSITENSSTISYSAVAKGGSTSTKWVYLRTRTIKATSNGSTVLSRSASSKIQVTNDYVIFSGSFVVPHNDDGTATFTMSATGAFYSSSVNSTGSATFTLDTIARASVPTVSPNPFTIGSAITIKTNRKSSSFTHTVKFNYGNNSETFNNVGSSITFTTSTVGNGIYALIPNATSYTGTITCDTYDGSTLIGTQRCSYTANATKSPPSFNASYQDTNATTTAITGNNQYIIQNQSTLQINLSNLIAYNSATIASAVCVINGVSYNGTVSGSTATFNIGTLNVSSDTTASITVTDSRGYAGTQTLNISVYAWSLPSAIITLERENNFYSNTYITVDADYSSIGGNNTITIQYRYKKTTTSTWGSWASLSDNVQSTFTADNTFQWNVQVKLTDAFGTTTYNLTLQKGVPIIYFDRLLGSSGFNSFPEYEENVAFNGVHLFYEVGESVTLPTYSTYIGSVTTSQTYIYFNIQLPRWLAKVSSVTITNLVCNIRTADGGYIVGQGTDFTSYINSVSILQNSNQIRVGLYNSNGWTLADSTPATNNVPVSVQLSAIATLTFA